MACSGLGPLPVSIPDEIANHIKSASDAARIEIAAVSATYNMTDPDKARRAFTAIAGAARRMGTGLVTVCSGSKDPQDQWRRHPANDDPASWIEMCREIEFMLGLAEQHDLTIGVEPEPANVVSSPSNAARLLSDFSGSRLRIILDPVNILEGVPPGRQHSTIDLAFDLLGPAIVLAHAKDRHSDGRVAPAGEGTVDWNYFLTGLSSLGFDGHLIAHGMSANEAPSVAYYLRQELTRI